LLSVLLNDAAIYKDYIALVIDEWNMSMERCWNDTGRWKQTLSEANLLQRNLSTRSPTLGSGRIWASL